MSLAPYSLGHSGRTDVYGGHKCSQKSINKGLCSGYHYHNRLKLEKSTQVDLTPKGKAKKNEIKNAKGSKELS